MAENKLHKALNTDELQKQLNEYFSTLSFRIPEILPEYDPDNWSEDYKEFRAKYPDDWHKRYYRAPRFRVCQEPEKPTELDYSMLNSCVI